MSSLTDKTIHGVSWSFIDNLAGSGISFLVGIVLARLLTPAEFGILGMIAIFIAVSNSLIDSGFSSALIRKTDASETDYNTVFYFNLLFGLILYFLLFISAPAISHFFRQPLLIPVTRVMGIVLVINAFSIIQRTLLEKKVDFKTQAIISLSASVISGGVGIGLALNGKGVWSLVAQQLSRQLINSLLLWIFSQWRPARLFSFVAFREMFGFGSKLMVSGLINTIYKNIYYVVIGKFYSAPQLGQYTRAELFSSVISGNMTSVIQRVSYPVLSTIQDEQERLKQAYRRVIKTTMLLSFGGMLALAAVAKPLVVLLIGEKWLPAVPFMQLLCLSEMLYPLHAINLNILQVKGRSDLFLKLEVYKKILAVGPVVAGIFGGIEMMLWGGIALSVISFLLNSHYSSELVNYSTRAQIMDVLPTFGISVLVAAAMWSIGLAGLSLPVTIVLQLVAGLVAGTLMYELFRLPEYLEMKGIVMSVFKK